MRPTIVRSVVACLLAVSLAVTQQLFAQSGLKIVVIDGEDGVNIIQKNTAVKPIVEVRDKNDLPVAGAIVTFTIAGAAGNAVFEGGLTAFTISTDAAGRAIAANLQPLTNGAFQIQVQASYQGQLATTAISQTNFATAAEAAAAGKTPGSQSSSSQGSSSSGGSSSGGASGGAGGGAGAGSAAAAGGAAGGGGIGAGTIAGIAAAGAGAVGAGYAYKELKQVDCTSEVDQMLSALDREMQVCTGFNSTQAQCRSAAQSVFDSIGTLCSCAGESGEVPAEYRTFFQDAIRELRADGFNTNSISSCNF
jgi:hypothetical protein